MKENLDRARCTHLRDMGMPQDVEPGDWVYVAGGVTPTLWLEFNKPAMGHIKLPSNDELEAFVIDCAYRLHPDQLRTIVTRCLIELSSREYIVTAEYTRWGRETKIWGDSAATEPLALYNLIEKLDAMIGGKNE